MTLFLEQISGFKMPSSSSIQRSLKDVFIEYIAEVRHVIGENFIWIGVDTTTDKESRIIGNVTAGTLIPADPQSQQIFLLHIDQIEHD